jgi:iron complex transport system ATP-binding protein
LLSDGKVLGVVRPKDDPIEKTEEMLGKIYGKISLQICRGRDGREHMVMIKENEE